MEILVPLYSKKVIIKLLEVGDIEDIWSYCTCKTGTRTLGGCAHATSILILLIISQSTESIINISPTSKFKAKTLINISEFKKTKKNQINMENMENDIIMEDETTMEDE